MYMPEYSIFLKITEMTSYKSLINYNPGQILKNKISPPKSTEMTGAFPNGNAAARN